MFQALKAMLKINSNNATLTAMDFLNIIKEEFSSIIPDPNNTGLLELPLIKKGQYNYAFTPVENDNYTSIKKAIQKSFAVKIYENKKGPYVAKLIETGFLKNAILNIFRPVKKINIGKLYFTKNLTRPDGHTTLSSAERLAKIVESCTQSAFAKISKSTSPEIQQLINVSKSFAMVQIFFQINFNNQNDKKIMYQALMQKLSNDLAALPPNTNIISAKMLANKVTDSFFNSTRLSKASVNADDFKFVDQPQTPIKTAESELKETNNKLVALRLKYNSIINENSILKQQLENAENKYQILKNSELASKKEIETAIININELNAKIDKNNQEISALKQENAKVKEQLISAGKLYNALVEKSELTEKELKNAKNENSNLKNKLAEVNDNYLYLNNNYKKVSESLNNAKKEMEDLNLQKKYVSNKLEELKELYKKLSNKNNSTEKVLKETQLQIEILNQNKNKIENDLLATKYEYGMLYQTYLNTQTQLKDSQKIIKDLKLEIENSKKETEEYKSRYEHILEIAKLTEKKLEEANKIVANLKTKSVIDGNAFKIAIDQKDKELFEFNKKNRNIAEENKFIKSGYEQAKQYIEEVKDKNRILSDKMLVANVFLERFKNTQIQNEKDFLDAKQKYEELLKSNSATKEQLKNAEFQVKETQSKNKDFEKMIANANQELEDAHNTIAKNKERIANKNKETKKNKERINQLEENNKILIEASKPKIKPVLNVITKKEVCKYLINQVKETLKEIKKHETIISKRKSKKFALDACLSAERVSMLALAQKLFNAKIDYSTWEGKYLANQMGIDKIAKTKIIATIDKIFGTNYTEIAKTKDIQTAKDVISKYTAEDDKTFKEKLKEEINDYLIT
ncbi:MAG: hypothetical protein RR140_01790 [Clostridia bacterium]